MMTMRALAPRSKTDIGKILNTGLLIPEEFHKIGQRFKVEIHVMHSILIIFEKSKISDKRIWDTFLRDLKNDTTISGCIALPIAASGKEILLLLRDAATFPAFSTLTTLAQNFEIPYKIIFIEKASEWEWQPKIQTPILLYAG